MKIVEKEDVLNILYHTKILVEKALKCSNSHEEAAEKLGISVRTLYRHKVSFELSIKPRKIYKHSLKKRA